MPDGLSVCQLRMDKPGRRYKKTQRKSRMFEGLRTWNPWFGCNYHCYRDGCWPKKILAHRLGRGLKCDRCYNFTPHYHQNRLAHIPKDPRIFVVAHGDFFAPWVPHWVIEEVLEVCRETPKEMWFFETKNPVRYLNFLKLFPENTMLSTTIETNRNFTTDVRGHTPLPIDRFRAIIKVGLPVHISIEPILDFDLKELLRWMKVIAPVKVSVGYDSLNNMLPGPGYGKTVRLIEELEKFTEVERKQI